MISLSQSMSLSRRHYHQLSTNHKNLTTATMPHSQVLLRAGLLLLLIFYSCFLCGTFVGVESASASAQHGGALSYQALDRATRQHIALVKQMAECSVPQPRVVCVADLFPDQVHHRKYSPHCTVLHMCAKDTGCCLSEKQVCSPAELQEVALPFFVATVHRGRWRGEIDTIKFENHTRCECRTPTITDLNGVFGDFIPDQINRKTTRPQEGGPNTIGFPGGGPLGPEDEGNMFLGSNSMMPPPGEVPPGAIQSVMVTDFNPVLIDRIPQQGNFRPPAAALSSRSSPPPPSPASAPERETPVASSSNTSSSRVSPSRSNRTRGRRGSGTRSRTRSGRRASTTSARPSTSQPRYRSQRDPNQSSPPRTSGSRVYYYRN